VHQPDWAHLAAGQLATVEFGFWLPLLATGDYTVTVALAAGTQLEHVQHHWVHDILSFKASANPHLSGLFTLEQSSCQVHPGSSGSVS
jgi:lipopolysaccharide transport system ATP-binding protein